MTWEMLASGFGLVEGPTIDTDGSLVFSDVLDGGVHCLAADGSISLVVPKRRGIGGIKRHASGGFVIGGRDLQHARDGETATVFALVDAMGFNDFGTDSAGRIYVGSVRWDSLNPAAEHQPGELWRVDLDGSGTMLYDSVNQCNGVGLSPDDRTIYHSDTRSKCLIAHDLTDNGTAINRRHIELGVRAHPDGLAVDVTGAVWVIDFGASRVIRITPEGTIDSVLETPIRRVTSVCFDGTSLIVVSAADPRSPELRGSIWRTDVGVAGAAVYPARVATSLAQR